MGDNTGRLGVSIFLDVDELRVLRRLLLYGFRSSGDQAAYDSLMRQLYGAANALRKLDMTMERDAGGTYHYGEAEKRERGGGLSERPVPN